MAYRPSDHLRFATEVPENLKDKKTSAKMGTQHDAAPLVPGDLLNDLFVFDSYILSGSRPGVEQPDITIDIVAG